MSHIKYEENIVKICIIAEKTRDEVEQMIKEIAFDYPYNLLGSTEILYQTLAFGVDFNKKSIFNALDLYIASGCSFSLFDTKLLNSCNKS